MKGDRMAEGGVVRQLNTMEMPDVPSTPDESVHLRERGREFARSWKNIPHHGKSQGLRARFDEALGVLAGLQHALRGHPYDTLSEDL
jgi:hypothetical protein